MLARGISFSLFLFCLGLFSPLCQAQVEEGLEFFPGAYARGSATPVSVVVGAEVEIKSQFKDAMRLISEGKLGLAATHLQKLGGLASSQGYSNLPDFSMSLLKAARQAEEEGRATDANFLSVHATDLSSSDPRVYFVAATLYRSAGIKRAFSSLFSGLVLLPSYPLVFATIALNVLLLALVAATLAFFVVCVVQLVRNAERIFVLCSRFGPRALRGYFALSLLLTIMIAPFYGGLLCALGCWALVLSRIRESSRWLPAYVGALVLAWGLSLPVVSTVSYNANLQGNVIMQDLSNMSYSPKGEEFLTESLQQRPDDPLLLLSVAQINHLKGASAAAESAYMKVLSNPLVDEGLQATAKLNLASLEYKRGEFERALKLYEGQRAAGVNSFELSYNLSLTHLALLDTVRHRDYYLEAKAFDEQRLSALDVLEVTSRAPVMSGVASSSYLPLLATSILSHDAAAFDAAQAKQVGLAKSLLRKGTVSSLLMWGGLVLLAALLSGMKRPSAHRLLSLGSAIFAKKDEESRIWLLLPGGMYIAGDRPLLGAAMLMLCVMFLLAALDLPVSLFAMSSLEASFDMPLLFASASVFVLAGIVSLLTIGGKSNSVSEVS